MRIAVVLFDHVSEFPPTQALVACLLRMGHEVTLFSFGGAEGLCDVEGKERLTACSLGEKGAGSNALQREMFNRRGARILRGAIERESFDLIWTANDIAARNTGRILLKHRHVMQMLELVHEVPYLTSGTFPLQSKLTIELARNAAAVVVPEYNRSFIQAAWWDLPRRPFVLPNKSVFSSAPLDEQYQHSLDTIASEKRTILLYQGVYSMDRNLFPVAEAVSELGEGYALYIMGRATTSAATEEFGRLRREYPDSVVDLGFVPSPQHLNFTAHGSIGLLPYTVDSGGSLRFSKLNSLYCAPNKIWEYSCFGLPMLGSDVPGLTGIIEGRGMGRTVDLADSSAVAEAILEISQQREEMSKASKDFYDSVDFDGIVASILEVAA